MITSSSSTRTANTSYSSDVKDEGYLHAWGKKREYKASKFFHVKHGVSKFITYNKYKKVEKKDFEIEVEKYFGVGYNGDKVYPKNVYLDLTLVCENGESITLKLGKNDYSAGASKVRGQECYLEEKFYSDDYQTKQFNVKYVNYSYHKEGSKGETYNDCYTKEEHGKDHDYCQTSEPYKKFHIYIDEHATKVVFYITDNVMKKEEKKKLEVYITKYFKAEYGDDYNYPEYRKNYDEVIIYLICDDYKEEIKLDEHGKYYSADRYDLYGKKNC